MKKKEEKSYLKTVWLIITNKADTNGKMVTETLCMITAFIFNLFALALALFAVSCIYGAAKQFAQMAWQTMDEIIGNFFQMVITIGAAAIFALLALMMRGSANEVGRQKNKNYIFSVFSGMVSFTALIVALIALCRGMA